MCGANDGAGHHVLQAAGILHGLEEPIGFFQRTPHRGHTHRNVLAVFKHVHAMLSVVRRIRSAKYCLDRIVLYKFFERVVGLLTASGLRQAVPSVRK
jgi:hypothetical protein